MSSPPVPALVSASSLKADFLWRLSAWMRATADATITRDTVTLRAGEHSFSSPLSFSPEATALQEAEMAASALQELWRQTKRSAGRLRLLVADRWLRPLTILLDGHSLSDREVASLVMHQYEHVYGALMTGWQSRWHLQRDGSVIAMAWPAPLVEVRSALVACGVTIVSARPLSLYAVSRIKFTAASAWVILIEKYSMTVVRLEGRNWRHWRVGVLAEPTLECAVVGFLRMVAQTEDGCRDVWVVCPGISTTESAQFTTRLASENWHVHYAGVSW